MKVCVFGAGAIGSFVAASLVRGGGHEVSAVARGGQLEALQARGLTVRIGGAEWQMPIHATADAGALGPQDLVFVCLKAPTITPAVHSIKSLLVSETTVVFLLNGIPWWYYYKHGGSKDGQHIPCLDPSDEIWNEIGPQRVLGGVVYCSATVVSPGVVGLDYADVRIELGEPDGSDTERLKDVTAMLGATGIKATMTSNIRRCIWQKLVLNMITGPSAVLAQAPLCDLFAQHGFRDAAVAMLKEAISIASAAGSDVEVNIDAAISKISASKHKPSILQDLDAGRPMEIDPLYRLPLDIARAHGVSTPMLDTLCALVKLRARAAGNYIVS